MHQPGFYSPAYKQYLTNKLAERRNFSLEALKNYYLRKIEAMRVSFAKSDKFKSFIANSMSKIKPQQSFKQFRKNL